MENTFSDMGFAGLFTIAVGPLPSPPMPRANGYNGQFNV